MVYRADFTYNTPRAGSDVIGFGCYFTAADLTAARSHAAQRCPADCVVQSVALAPARVQGICA